MNSTTKRGAEYSLLSAAQWKSRGRIPQVGDVLDIGDLQLKLESVEKRHATRILVLH